MKEAYCCRVGSENEYTSGRTLLYLARLASNLPVVSPDRFRTFLKFVRSGWLPFDTVLTVAGVLLSGTAATTRFFYSFHQLLDI
jgi:hypothetical protein